VVPEAVAYDVTQGELWVGLVLAARERARLRLDVNLALDGIGMWEWKGLAGTFEAAARGPGR
jgi:hypothetical protein